MFDSSVKEPCNVSCIPKLYSPRLHAVNARPTVSLWIVVLSSTISFDLDKRDPVGTNVLITAVGHYHLHDL